MKKITLFTAILLFAGMIQAQLSPGITSWLQNTTETGSYYMANNSTAIDNNFLVNCQKVEYSTDFVCVTTTDNVYKEHI